MSDLIERISYYLATGSHIDYRLREVLTDCKAALEAKGEAVLYFYSGPQGFFYVPTMEQGEIILSLMNVDEEDWTATKLATPPSVDALIAEIDGLDVPPVAKQKLKFITDKYRRGAK